MHRVLVLGAGKIGALISGLLGESGDYRVDLADLDGAAAEAVVKAHGLPMRAGLRLRRHRPGELAGAPRRPSRPTP
jgi:saccharopine dehydrogenase-like NADP-dependent oxidoreductase